MLFSEQIALRPISIYLCGNLLNVTGMNEIKDQSDKDHAADHVADRDGNRALYEEAAPV